jgi:hypothetical protein
MIAPASLKRVEQRIGLYFQRAHYPWHNRPASLRLEIVGVEVQDVQSYPGHYCPGLI